MTALALSRGARAAVFLLVVALAAACDSPTASQSLPIRLEAVRLETAEDLRSWPSAPVASGSDRVVVRGLARSGCGSLTARASRRSGRVMVRIETEGDHTPCELSRWAWEPFLASTDPLPPGRYEVTVIAAGHSRRTDSRVSVGAP